MQVLEEVGDALYKDAQNRSIRRAMLEAQAEAELHERRNQPKISKASDRLAFRRLEREVLEIYDALEKTATGLTYEEFGAAMVALGGHRTFHSGTEPSTAPLHS